MKNFRSYNRLVLSFFLVLFFCTLRSTGLASGLFDGVLPTPAPTLTPAPVSTPATTSTRDSLREMGEGLFQNSSISRPASTDFILPDPIAALVEELTQSCSQPSLSQNGETSTLIFSIPASQMDEAFLTFAQAGILKLTVDLENSALILEYSDAAEELSAPTATPTHAPVVEVDDYCSICHGTGDCNHCVFGKCDHCFGDGDFYCTGGCLGGRCIACDDGKVLVGFDSKDRPKYRNCSYCRGGVCKKCGGDGYIDCSYCRGTGDCTYCRGTGDCQYCD